MNFGKIGKIASKNNDMFNHLNTKIIIEMVLKGAIVGLFGGIGGATFRYGIQFMDCFRDNLMSYTDITSVILWIILVSFLGIIAYFLLKWEPMSGGSGIPQIEGEMMGLFDMRAVPVAVSKYLGGLFNALAGFSLGREGPSVQLGGAIGKGVSKLFKSTLREERILISAGAAAGLTAAFSAPVSGAVFVFEEVHKSFYPKLVIPTFSAVLVSNFVTSVIFDLKPSLGFSVMKGLPLYYFGHLLLLGVFVGIVGVIFNKVLLGYKTLYNKIKIHNAIKLVITFIAVSAIGYSYHELLGGGNSLVGMLAQHRYAAMYLFMIICGKILLTSFCFGSGVQGGIFLPILVIGASSGAFMQEIMLTIGMSLPQYLPQIVICAMGGILASTIRSPLLSILLVLEMTNSFNNIYAIGTVTIVSYLVAELLKEPPVYDSLLWRMIKGVVPTSLEQTFFETKIPVTSTKTGKKLKELGIPQHILIVSIERLGAHIVPDANTTLQVGDSLSVSCPKKALKETKKFFKT